ncbi:MAG: hypothetical protein KatS3mg085_848 [Candidatus Dojkabacteria bacterium]|nr:MAG: hypothetical protein KatS3mg085_848 [Candidatus Dojkabacteria bacterium]
MDKLSKTQIVLLVLLVILVPLSFILAIVTTNQINRDVVIEDNTSPTIFWNIKQVSPNVDNPQHFDLLLESSSGAIKTYRDILSFGLSNSKTMLAIHLNNGIEIIDFINDSSKNVIFSEESYVGDSGNSLSWSFDDNFIAFTAVNTSNINETRVWIISNDGSQIQSFQAPLISWQDETGKVYVEKIEFSPFNNLLLARTFREEDRLLLNDDNQEYQLTELPVLLTVYDIKGQVVENIEIRDYGSAKDKIYFSWVKDSPGYIKYGVFGEDEEIDPNDMSKLTFIKI